ncbi:MAG: hypothetical protein ACOYN0_20270 [Phycisphaerales bacterium]
MTRVLGVHASGQDRFVLDPVLLETVVSEVVQKRRVLVEGPHRSHSSTSDVRCLCWYPEWTDFVALGVETGVVDDCDAPAWDLWTGVERRETGLCLVAAVPPWLEPMAQQAISLSPTACLEWQR